MKKKKQTMEIDVAIAEDPLIQGLLEAREKRVEIIAFGVCYIGMLQSVDADNGTIVVVDGDDRAMLEIERIESLSLLPS